MPSMLTSSGPRASEASMASSPNSKDSSSSTPITYSMTSWSPLLPTTSLTTAPTSLLAGMEMFAGVGPRGSDVAVKECRKDNE